MSRNDLEKFRSRLVLRDFFRSNLGIPINDKEARDNFYNNLEENGKGKREGLYKVTRILSNTSEEETVTGEKLYEYDKNIQEHMEKINEDRSTPIKLKPFQVLAAIITEFYLDQISRRPQDFVNELNEFAEEENNSKGRIKYPKFSEEDLDQIAFWMATGSGKTIIMHLNFYQYLEYSEKAEGLAEPDSVFLITPDEDMSTQHKNELKKSSIKGLEFNAQTANRVERKAKNTGETLVKIIENTKLYDEGESDRGSKSEEAKMIDVSKLQGKNLVLVDEGHKGMQGDSWRRNRKKISEEGFTCEYSATFGQAVSNASVGLQEEYGRGIIYDYSYPRFHSDGYGKDYKISNIEENLNENLRHKYLLGNLLKFYEQIELFNQNKFDFQTEYNIERPLQLFVGTKVNKERDNGRTDIEEVVVFFDRIINETEWTVATIEDILAGESGLMTEHGDFFEGELSRLKEIKDEPEDVYQDLIKHIFQEESFSEVSESNIIVHDIENTDGEIGLELEGSSDKFFGLIDIGDKSAFIERLRKYERIEIDKNSVEGSLFQNLDSSDINILIGAKKFLEGWDSWRVSSMGLLHFGRGKGPQVIQLFGRGVRLLGKDHSLKRSTQLKGKHPKDLQYLEKLNVFGLRAKYMKKFSKYLEKEGIDTKERETVEIETKKQDRFQKEKLKIISRDVEDNFEENLTEIEVEETETFEIDLVPEIGEINSDKNSSAGRRVSNTIDDDLLPYLDWNNIYRKIWSYRKKEGLEHLEADRKTLKEIVKAKNYELKYPSRLLEVKIAEDIEQLEEAVVELLKEYLKKYDSWIKKQKENENLSFVSLNENLDNEKYFVDKYELSVKKDKDDLIDQIKTTKKSGDIYKNDEGSPNRVHIDRHLYLPLIAQEDDIKYSPPALNSGEKEIAEKLKEFLTQESSDKLDNYEVFLLRNKANLGVGFDIQPDGDTVYPDFILWLVGDSKQEIVFLEPHGLQHAGDPISDPKVKLHDQIEEYQENLENPDNQDIELHSFVISETGLKAVKDNVREENFTRSDAHKKGLFFKDESIEEILDLVLE